MVTTIPYIIHYNIIHRDKSIYLPNPDRDTKSWTIFLKMHIMSSLSFRTISIWLTVYLACFRYFYLRTSFNKKVNSTNILNRIQNWIQENFLKLNRIIMGVVIVYITGIIFNIPLYFCSSVKEEHDFVTWNDSDSFDHKEPRIYYYLEQSEINLKINNLTMNVMVYSQILLNKLIPCLLIFIFTTLLVHRLIAKKRNENKLRKGMSIGKLLMEQSMQNQSSIKRSKRFSSLGLAKRSTLATANGETLKANNETKSIQNDDSKMTSEIPSSLGKYSSKRLRSSKDNSRTTFMLIVVCFLFLLVEFPIMVLSILSIGMDEIFYNDIYIPLVEFIDLSVLMYTSINLMLYVSMSSAFRKTLYRLMKRFICK